MANGREEEPSRPGPNTYRGSARLSVDSSVEVGDEDLEDAYFDEALRNYAGVYSEEIFHGRATRVRYCVILQYSAICGM